MFFVFAPGIYFLYFYKSTSPFKEMINFSIIGLSPTKIMKKKKLSDFGNETREAVK